jgi:hypothetical protein
VDYRVNGDKGRHVTCNTWTSEEEAILLAHLEANSWSCSDFSGKHMFTVTQGGGEGGGVHHSQYGGGK